MKNTRLPPLNSLQAFEAAGRHQSFLEAAAEQQVSSGAISRHVRILERYLGTELFVRLRNGVTLTSAGKAYARSVSGIFRDLKTATDGVKKPSADDAIVISTLPIFADRWLFHRIRSFRDAFGPTRLQVECHDREHDVNPEDVDAWILYSDGHHPGYSVTRLFGEAIFPVCSPEFRRTLSERPTADEVLRQPLLHDKWWDTDWPDWAPAYASRSTRASSRPRSTAWAWPSDTPRCSPRNSTPASWCPSRISRSIPENTITWSWAPRPPTTASVSG